MGERDTHFLRRVKRLRKPQDLGCQPSHPSCVRRYRKRCLKPGAAWLLVGSSALVMATGYRLRSSATAPILAGFQYRMWKPLQPVILALSFFGGLYFGLAAFFWLGAIRLVFSLHAQCFVNSICHSEPGTPVGEDSSCNVRWLGFMQFFQGENWHRNHHARPASARLGRTWKQPDVGYVVICMLEKVGLVSDVRHSQHLGSV